MHLQGFTANFNHGLYGSTNCCISHGPSQWQRAIFDPPQLRDLLTSDILVTVIVNGNENKNDVD